MLPRFASNQFNSEILSLDLKWGQTGRGSRSLSPRGLRICGDFLRASLCLYPNSHVAGYGYIKSTHTLYPIRGLFSTSVGLGFNAHLTREAALSRSPPVYILLVWRSRSSVYIIPSFSRARSTKAYSPALLQYR
jgi:hypothetical protein